jgi:oxygen-independent coproporphyrinogen-3 oxidase
MASAEIGVYVHFPWCLRKCPYCDFTSFEATRGAIDHRGYTDAVLTELELRAEALSGRALRSIYFGGGTPSLWDPAAIGQVIEAVHSFASPNEREVVEITVECNPSSFDVDRARALIDAGVNRVSIGVQGLDASRLAFLGRLHDGPGGLAAVEAALEAGVPRVSADLIYGVAAGADGPQRAAEAAADARRLADLGVGHMSAYALTIEPNTKFGELNRQRRLPLVGEDEMVASFMSVRAALEERGFNHYEISSFARTGQESRHNLGYWRGDDYLGLGCAAWGTLSRADGSAFRYRNPPVPDRYLEQTRTRRLKPHELEELDPETRLRERLMLGLRTHEGIDLETVARDLGVDPWPAHRAREAERLCTEGRLERNGGHLRVPKSAWTFADGTAASLF